MFALTEVAESKNKLEEIELRDLVAKEFKEFLGVTYPTRYPIADANVISLFRIVGRYEDYLISKMTCDDIKDINQNENKRQLGLDVLQVLCVKHIRIHHP